MRKVAGRWSRALSIAVATALTTAAVLVAPSASAAPNVVVSPLGARTYSLSSYYGPRCMPVASASTWHLGQDMGAASGTRINAVADGTVLRAGAVGGLGQWVVLQHTIGGRTVSTVYGHVIDGDRYVRAGQKVSAGQRIADVGSTGTSTSPHLHLEVWNGTYGSGASHTDPLTYLKGRGVDLAANATRVAPRTTPSSCTYYANTETNLRAGAGTSWAVLAVVPRGGQVTAKPGDESGSWRRVTYNGRTGWVSAALIGPTKPASTTPPPPPPPAPPRPKPQAPTMPATRPAEQNAAAVSSNQKLKAAASAAVAARPPKGTKPTVQSSVTAGTEATEQPG